MQRVDRSLHHSVIHSYSVSTFPTAAYDNKVRNPMFYMKYVKKCIFNSLYICRNWMASTITVAVLCFRIFSSALRGPHRILSRIIVDPSPFLTNEICSSVVSVEKVVDISQE